MMENKMAWQEGYEHGYAAAQEEFNIQHNELVTAWHQLTIENSELVTKCHQLTAERDAAVAELTNQSACWTCKKNADCHSRPVEEPSIRCGLYEWRGLSLAAETSDKEEKHE